MDPIEIRELSFRLSEQVRGFRKRWIFEKLKSSIGKEPRIKLLRGFRGTGKTTLLLQLFLENEENSIYFSLENPRIEKEGLYEVGKKLIENGYKILLIDEVHTYPKWRRDLKALYDEYPKVTFIVSGSAPLVFVGERREEELNLSFLSLSEFLYLKEGVEIKAKEEWKSTESSLKFLSKHPELKENWENYLSFALPLYIKYKEKTKRAIFNSIRKSIREDASFFLKVSGEKIAAMEKFIYYLALSKLGEFSINSICKNLGIGKYTMYELLNLLEKMEIIRIVHPFGKTKGIRGEPKIMFAHPSLRIAICSELGEEVDIGAVREEIAVFSLLSRGWKVNTIKGKKKAPDYIIKKGREKLVVEIGGESKSKSQLKGFKGTLITPRQLITLASF